MESPNQATNVTVSNALANPIQAQVQTKLVEIKDVKFNFRKTEVPMLDDQDKPVMKDGAAVMKDFKRPSITIGIPLLTVAGIAAALSANDKTTELVAESVNAVIIDTARGIINDVIDGNPKIELTPEVLPLDKLAFHAIALLPRGERGIGIPKEDFAAFVKDYKEVMASPEAVQLFQDKKPRSPEVLEKHGIILGGKFNQVKSRKDVIGQMLGFMDIYLQLTPNAEDHSTVYEFLYNKGKALMEGESFDDL